MKIVMISSIISSLVTELVNNPPAMWETWVPSLGWEDPLEKGKATHSSILAWRIPRTIQSMGFSRPEYQSGPPFSSSGDLPNSGIVPRSPACRLILYQLSHKGSPRILEWVAYPFSSGSSQPTNRTGFSALDMDSLPTELSGKL